MPRTLKTTNQSRSKSLQLVGSVQACFPAPSEEGLEKQISFDQLLIKNPTSTFLMKVVGLSMKNIGIFEGDIVVIDRSVEAGNGSIVVAYLDEGFTLKSLKLSGPKVLAGSRKQRYCPYRASIE